MVSIAGSCSCPEEGKEKRGRLREGKGAIDMAEQGGAKDGGTTEVLVSNRLMVSLWVRFCGFQGGWLVATTGCSVPIEMAYRGSGRGEDYIRLPAATLSHLTSLALGWKIYFTFVKVSSSIRR
jgi:hypothetical protein